MTRSGLARTDTAILVASPNDREAGALGQSLSGDGYSVELATHPLQAMEKLMSANFKAAILIPQMDDRSWLESIGVFNNLFPYLPIIIVAETDSLETERLLRQGRIFYYLLKPVDMTEIRAVLRDASDRALTTGN